MFLRFYELREQGSGVDRRIATGVYRGT